ncbi:TetR family transcriptional regulator [Mycobacteroides stephanolepidis]|uniref:TetR family transcriptional regulator n=1 Tax=[Mycobacterium] stephanolepidis TaxID=1520670 RepID=A0A1Z4ETA8_9MYCO|nr:TetR family transcriptional regulator [[Mycobacterium] stephanolepidis]BAX96198.1 TetR family transcriptional regulator [[Mycobacterium] stephanolepidis]
MDSPTVWRGRTMQDRAAERRNRLIDAGFDLLGTEGVAGTSVSAVCRNADLTRNYFYESFAGIDELLRAVQDRVNDELRAVIETSTSTGNLEHRLKSIFLTAAQYFEEDPRRVRVTFRETLGNEVLRENANQGAPAFVLFTMTHFLDLLDGLSVPAVRSGDTAIAFTQIYGALAITIMDWLEGRLEATAEQIARSCTQLVLAVIDAHGWRTPLSQR